MTEVVDTCLASAKPWVQIPVPPKEEKIRKYTLVKGLYSTCNCVGKYGQYLNNYVGKYEQWNIQIF
jgi:hypothetical protein